LFVEDTLASGVVFPIAALMSTLSRAQGAARVNSASFKDGGTTTLL